MKKIAIVSTLQPETHYSRFLIDELILKIPALEIWADKDKKNFVIEYKNLKLCWSKGLFFPWQIFWQALISNPQIIHIQHEVNMYGGKFSALLFPLMLWLLKILGKKIIVTVHAVVPKTEINTDFLTTFNFPKGWFYQKLIKLFFTFLFKNILYFSDKIIVHSNYLKEVLVNDYNGEKLKISVIPIGVSKPDNKKYLLKSPWSRNLKDKKIILYFGYILRRKGLEYLIAAAEKLILEYKNIVFILAGGELDYQKDYAAKLKAKVKKRKLANSIIFTGFISQEEILALYQRCQFAVLPYTYSISSSLPLSFAMQYQKPVIATNIGSLKEEVEDNIDGILVEPTNDILLFQAMKNLITNRKLYQKLSDGQKIKLQKRSWKNVAEKTSIVYNKVCKETL